MGGRSLTAACGGYPVIPSARAALYLSQVSIHAPNPGRQRAGRLAHAPGQGNQPILALREDTPGDQDAGSSGMRKSAVSASVG